MTVQISAAGDLVTHRLVARDSRGLLHTKGDANPTRDVRALRPELVRGVVQRGLPNLGYVIVFLRQPQGVLGVMTSASALFLLWGICFPASEAAAETTSGRRARVAVPEQRSGLVVVPNMPLRTPPTPPPASGRSVEVSIALRSGAVRPTRVPQPRGPRPEA